MHQMLCCVVIELLVVRLCIPFLSIKSVYVMSEVSVSNCYHFVCVYAVLSPVLV